MKIFLLAALSLAAVLMVAPVSYAQGVGGSQVSPPPPPKPVPTPDPQLDLGKLEGSTYTNEHFGVSFTAPKGWTILDVGVMKAMKDNAKGLFSDEKNEKLKSGFEASVDRTTPLFSASKLPPGTTGSFNAVLLCAAEFIPTAIVKTPRDYYDLMLHSMKISQGIDVEVVEPFQMKRIGATDFGTYTLKLKTNAGVMVQKHLLTIKTPYAFGIILTYVDESDARAFDELISSVRAK